MQWVGLQCLIMIFHTWIKKVLSEGVHLRQRYFGSLLVDVDPNITLCCQSPVRQQNAILMAFCWRPDDGPKLNADLVNPAVVLCFVVH